VFDDAMATPPESVIVPLLRKFVNVEMPTPPLAWLDAPIARPPGLVLILDLARAHPPSVVGSITAVLFFAAMAVASGLDRRQSRRIEFAVQPFAVPIDGANQIAALVNSDGDVAPALGFELGDQSFARLPLGERRRAVAIGLRRARAGPHDEKSDCDDAHGRDFPVWRRKADIGADC
jgi:hypothetical protein